VSDSTLSSILLAMVSGLSRFFILVGSPVGGSASKVEARKELNEREYWDRWILPRCDGKPCLAA